ncbi:MAG: glycosyltransferase family 2 protein [Deltaproteobacteria bacterium]|nr:glycosyltransferase family 2 protein [Deltaproteobacteria bacterium]
MGAPRRHNGDVSEARALVSFVLPCLNEARTLEACIREVQACIREHGLDAEIVVADNGSSDGSQAIAEAAGARVVHATQRGYGAALMAGFDAARGDYLVMGDSDLSYDFREAPRLLAKLRDGADLAMGSRFRCRIEPGAMPFLHRYLGNPMLSFVGRRFFRVPISDFHCGLRALTKRAYQAMELRTTGMEFASEMVVKAGVRKLRVAEAPVTLRPDGRGRPPHLRTWRDGWRHLRFLLTLSPRWTLMAPGAAFVLLGTALMLAGWFDDVAAGGPARAVNRMLVGSVLISTGYAAITTAFAMRIFALVEELGPPAPRLERSFAFLTLERGLAAGALATLVGGALLAGQVWSWAQSGWEIPDAAAVLRPSIVGGVLVAVGVQTILASFVYSMLGIRRRDGGPRA